MITPFGALLRFFRNQRGISPKEIARKIHISTKTLSAYETGYRRAPGGDDLRLICLALRLSPEETAALERAAEESAPTLRIPRSASPREYQVAHRFYQRLGQFSGDELDAIEALLTKVASVATARPKEEKHMA